MTKKKTRLKFGQRYTDKADGSSWTLSDRYGAFFYLSSGYTMRRLYRSDLARWYKLAK